MRAILPLLFCTCPALARSAAAHPATLGEPHLPQSATPAQGASRAPVFVDAQVLLWEPGVKNAYPRWSADGRRILYQTNRSGTWHVHVMDADGTDDRALTSGSTNNNFPDWSPDNESVAFVSDRDGNEEVYVMRMDGSGARNLSQHPARDIHPYFAPDGRTLLFNSTRAVERLQIYEVALDGTGLRRLVESPDDDTCARIAPAGESFLYLANLAIGQDDVLLRRRDGSAPVNVTNDRAPDGWPTWTPDGERIVFSSARTGSFRLYVMDASGGTASQLTLAGPEYADARAAVSADGTKIVFNRDSRDTIGVCVIDLPPASAPRPG